MLSGIFTLSRKQFKKREKKLSCLLNRKTAIFAAVLTAALLVIGGIVLNDIPVRDVASRYAPMCEAFARGDWQYAFHPRIQPLQVISGGVIVYLFNCDGFTALKIASALWFFAGIFTAWKLFRELYPGKPYIAAAAVVFCSIFPCNIHMAISGLRESGKTFILLLTALALVKIWRDVKSCYPYILLGIGCFLAVICRADMIMTGIFLLFTGAVLECREKIYPRKSLIAVALTAAGLLLNSFLNHRFCGHAMPDCRFAELFLKVTGEPARFADISQLTLLLMFLLISTAVITAWMLKKIPVAILMAVPFVFTVVLSIYTGMNDENNTTGEFICDLLNGIYHTVGIFSLLVIIFLIRHKRFNTGEFLLCLTLLANAFFNIVPMQLFHKSLYVSSRYLYVAMPLMAGFFAIGINEIYQFIREKINAKTANAVLTVACAAMCGGMIFHAIQPTLLERTREKEIIMRRGIWELATLIRGDYDGEKYRENIFDLNDYNSDQAPFIQFDSYSKITAAAYLAGGSSTNNDIDYFVGGKLPGRFRKKAVFLTEINFGKYSKKVWRITK